MDLNEVQTVGLVLRRYDYGETSQVGHMLTLAEGRISVLGKGIKKPNAYIKGPFDLFQVAKITYRRHRSGGLSLLQRYEPMTGFPLLRTKLPSLLGAFYLGEILYEAIREQDPNPKAFETMVRALGALEECQDSACRSIVLATELTLMRAFGFAMVLDKCVQCGRQAGQHAVIVYPVSGGVVCKRCPRPNTTGLRLEVADRRVLAALDRAGPGHGAKIPLSKRQHRTLRTLMRLAFQAVFDKPLKSEAFVLNPQFGFLLATRGSTADLATAAVKGQSPASS